MNASELLDLVVRLASALTIDFSVQDVLDQLAEELGSVLPVVGVGVLLIGPDGEYHVSASARGEARGEVARIEGLASERGEGPCPSAHPACEPAVVPDMASGGAAPVYAAVSLHAGVRTVLRFPIHRGAEHFGALEIYVTTRLDDATADLGSWQMLADVVASYLAIAQHRADEPTSVELEQLQRAAFHDPLTGLPNRRLLEDRLHQARERTRRMGAAYGVLFCDLDGFKPVNDRFGHDVGDRVLIELAQRLEEVVRPHDTVARVAGDEFVVLCEDLDGPGPAEDVAERILATVGAPFAVPGTDEEIRVGISIGIAVASRGAAEPPNEILARADAAMYRAKRCGGRHAAIAAPSPSGVHEPARARPPYTAAS